MTQCMVQTVVGMLPAGQAAAIEVERKAVEIASAKNQTVAQARFDRARGWLDALVWLGQVSSEDRERYLVEVLGVALFKRLNLTMVPTARNLGVEA